MEPDRLNGSIRGVVFFCVRAPKSAKRRQNRAFPATFCNCPRRFATFLQIFATCWAILATNRGPGIPPTRIARITVVWKIRGKSRQITKKYSKNSDFGPQNGPREFSKKNCVGVCFFLVTRNTDLPPKITEFPCRELRKHVFPGYPCAAEACDAKPEHLRIQYARRLIPLQINARRMPPAPCPLNPDF